MWLKYCPLIYELLMIFTSRFMTILAFMIFSKRFFYSEVFYTWLCLIVLVFLVSINIDAVCISYWIKLFYFLCLDISRPDVWARVWRKSPYILIQGPWGNKRIHSLFPSACHWTGRVYVHFNVILWEVVQCFPSHVSQSAKAVFEMVTGGLEFTLSII